MEKVKLIEELFQKKLGIVLKSSREFRKHTPQECAQAIGVETELYLEYESGAISPSLPELEVLSYYLEVPIDYFFSSHIQEEKPIFHEDSDLNRFFEIRKKVIATRLRTYRENLNMPPSKMVANTALTEEEYLQYEEGVKPIPLTHLQAFMYPLKCNIKEFLAEGGKIGDKYREQKARQTLEEIPSEVQKFLTNPSNEPYLRLAMHLSTLSADRLRSIAEGLLEITY